MNYELNTVYSNQKGFYGKARVFIEQDGSQTIKQLFSYSTHVATVISSLNGEKVAIVFGTYSQTTLKHIKEFLQQEGFKADTKSQIEKTTWRCFNMDLLKKYKEQLECASFIPTSIALHIMDLLEEQGKAYKVLQRRTNQQGKEEVRILL